MQAAIQCARYRKTAYSSREVLIGALPVGIPQFPDLSEELLTERSPPFRGFSGVPLYDLPGFVNKGDAVLRVELGIG